MTNKKKKQTTLVESVVPEIDPSKKMQISRVERSLERFPGLWSLHNSEVSKIIQRTTRDGDNNLITQRIEITPSRDGILTVQDQRTYYALVSLWESQGKPHKITFSLRQLCERLGLTGGSKNLNVIKLSLRRLRMVHLEIRNAFFSAKDMTRREEEVINLLTHLRIVESVGKKNQSVEGAPNRSVDDDLTEENEIPRLDFAPPASGLLDDLDLPSPASEQNFEKASTKSTCSVIIHPAIQQNLRLNYVRPILPEVIFSFKSRIAQLIYQYFDLMTSRGNRDERVVNFSVTTEKLFQQIDMYNEQFRQPSIRFQTLKKALDELQSVRVVDGNLSVSWTKRPDREYLIVAKRIRAVLKTKPKEPPLEMTDEYQAVVAFLETFDHTRRPRTGELTLAKDLIDQHHLTLEEFNLFLSVALRESEKTSFRPGDFSGTLRFFTTAYEDITAIRQQYFQEQQTVINQGIWEKMSPEEKEKFRTPIDDSYRRDLLEMCHGNEADVELYLDRMAFSDFDKLQRNVLP